MMNDPNLFKFAGAALKLNLDLGRPPRDVECCLCEDGKTVMLTAPDDRGHFACASFVLEALTDEGSFDHRVYEAAFR